MRSRSAEFVELVQAAVVARTKTADPPRGLTREGPALIAVGMILQIPEHEFPEDLVHGCEELLDTIYAWAGGYQGPEVNWLCSYFRLCT